MEKHFFHKTVLATALAAFVIAGCGGEDKKVPEEVIRPVRYINVSLTKDGRDRSFSGIAKAGTESRLSFRVPGIVEKINVNVGDIVKKGQVIAALDPADYQLKVQEAEAGLARARAEARNASANYARIRALYENRNASRNDLDASRAAADSSKAAVRLIEKQLELAGRQLDYTRIKAPSNCSVAAVPVEINENVAAGQAVVVVNCGDQLEVRLAVPGVLIARVRHGESVNVKFDAVPDKWFHAEITEVGVSSTALETTFPVTVRMTEADERIRPGMAAEVVFRLERTLKEPRIVVPPVAVGEDRIGRFVYVVEKGETEGLGIIKRQSVTVGQIDRNGLEITDGLKDGDIVVTAGISRIEDGRTVKLYREKR